MAEATRLSDLDGQDTGFPAWIKLAEMDAGILFFAFPEKAVCGCAVSQARGRE